MYYFDTSDEIPKDFFINRWKSKQRYTEMTYEEVLQRWEETINENDLINKMGKNIAMDVIVYTELRRHNLVEKSS